MLAHGASAELVHLRNETVEELAVVADDDSRAVEGVDSLFQHLLRCHVQVVGRLVEDEQVHRFEQQLYHSQTATLAARQHLYLFVDCLASEHERSENVLYLQTYVALSHAVECVEHTYLTVEQLRLVLCEVANLHVVTHLQIASERNLAHDALHERRLSLAVFAYECHFLATLYGEVNILEHGMLAVVLAHVLADDGVVARAKARREPQMHRCIVHFVHLDRHNLLQLLYAALHLNSLRRFVSEALYKVLYISYFLLLVLVSAQLLFVAFGTQFYVLVVLHFVVVHLSA